MDITFKDLSSDDYHTIKLFLSFSERKKGYISALIDLSSEKDIRTFLKTSHNLKSVELDRGYRDD